MTDKKLTCSEKKDVLEIKGKTLRELGDKLEKFILSNNAVPSDTDWNLWLPDEWLEIKKAVKFFNIFVK